MIAGLCKWSLAVWTRVVGVLLVVLGMVLLLAPEVSCRSRERVLSRERFTANQVGSLRRYRNIPRFQPPATPPDGEMVSIRKAAQMLGMNTSSIHRWLADGFIAGEQVTPGAPWTLQNRPERYKPR